MIKSLLILGAGRGLSVLVSLFLARWFGADAWGAASTARALTELPVLFSRGGAEQRVLKACASDRKGNLSRAQQIAGNMQALLLASLAVAILSYVVLPGQKVGLDVILVFAIAVTLHAPLQLKAVWEAILGRYRAFLADNVILQVLRGLLSVVLSPVFAGPLAIAVGYLVAVAVSLVMSGRKWLSPPKFQPSADLRENADLGVNYVLAGTMSRLDLLVVAAVLGSASAGAYAILHGVCSLIGIIGQAQGRLVAPAISRGLRGGDLDAGLKTMALAQKLIAAACVPLMFLVAPIAQELSYVMGSGFEFDWVLAMIVCASYSLSSVFSCEGYILSLGDKQHIERRLLFHYATVVGIGASVSAHLVGLTGVACAVLFANIMLIIGRRKAVANAIGANATRLLAWRSSQKVASILITLLSVGVLVKLDTLETMHRLFLVVVIGVGVAILSLFTILTNKDRQDAWRLLIGHQHLVRATE